MKLSKLFTKTSKNISSQIESVNAQLLTRAGYIYQEMAGVYAFLPLGMKVIKNIEQIVRDEMDKIGEELLMPALSGRERWHATKRHDAIDILMSTRAANEKALEKSTAEYILNPTHEEIITPIAKHFRTSYKDFPFAVYQIQTKFRNEARAKSGLLRGREFIMKDLYSFHTSEDDLNKFYELAKERYDAIFDRLGIGQDTYITFASGGDFTDDYSHEYQTVLESGEDVIYLDRKNKVAYNKEVATPEDAKKLGVNFDELEQVMASEVGNIFPLSTKFSEHLDYKYSDEDNIQKNVWMGSYGIGISRLMGVITEKFADDKGLVWPESIAPYMYHIVALPDEENIKVANKVYETLGEDKCLYDDRDSASTGERFADADLIGCPVQIVVSKKTLENNCVEVISRSDKFESFMHPIDEIESLETKLA
ncbi:proline--tRNA ligase [Candidatus Saccharibacteria bacterium]|jgi:prolyl-tRNA synthetase|nr:proline--tRNA ligase [Candidatus Saccharibacteria bacterium]